MSWFLAVHAPGPFVVALPVLSGLGFQLTTVPVMLTAYFAGQFLGGKLRRAGEPWPQAQELHLIDDVGE